MIISLLSAEKFPLFRTHQSLKKCFILKNLFAGTLILTPLFEVLFSKIGWRRSLQILAVANFLICMPLTMVFKPPGTRPVELDADEASCSDEEKLNMVDASGACMTTTPDRGEQETHTGIQVGFDMMIQTL